LSTALDLEITVKDGQIVQSNFNDYPLMKIAGVPSNFSMHILNWDENPTGVGEIPLPTVAPHSLMPFLTQAVNGFEADMAEQLTRVHARRANDELAPIPKSLE